MLGWLKMAAVFLAADPGNRSRQLPMPERMVLVPYYVPRMDGPALLLIQLPRIITATVIAGWQGEAGLLFFLTIRADPPIATEGKVYLGA